MAAIPALATLIAAAPIPTPIGKGSRYHPLPRGPAVAAGRPVAGMACWSRGRPRFGAHLELFARGLVVLVPAGIGIAPPIHIDGAYVLGGRCSYPARTREPTGVIEVQRDTALRLRELFALWGQPLSRTRLASFRTTRSRPVLAFVNGDRWHGDPGAIPLRKHAEIVLEIGGFVPPHSTYRFRKGL